MKPIFLVAFLLFISNLSFSQTSVDFESVKLEKASDYKSADTLAHLAANTLLSTPVDQNKTDRLKMAQFIMKWMAGTPDYTFSFDNSMKAFNNDLDLMTLYLASLTKYCLENPAQSKEDDMIKVNAWKILLSYCDNASNNVKLTKKVKKLIEANKNGMLEKEL